ncbi:MAG: class I SAM-dependent methyltransferase [Desulfovibrionaceae bacterium]|jgi:SAM-dependent methyltransferase|nr:class I SAM-dependent methyltransferase [Desulfovibrionaceae bacterium]
MNIDTYLRMLSVRPEPYCAYTARAMWDDEHVSASMLALHLDGNTELASRPMEFIERSAAWIDARFSLSGLRVADFGCGPGLYSNRFAARGARVTGLDFSRRSIEYARAAAREKGLDVDYRCLNYLEFEPDRPFDLATMIYGDFGALNPAQRGRMLDLWRGCLAPGGSVLFDVFSAETFGCVQAGVEHFRRPGGFWSPRAHHEFLGTYRYEELNLGLRRHVVVVPGEPGRVGPDRIEPDRVLDIFNWLQFYTPESLERELADHGFRVVAGFADLAGTPPGPADPVIAVQAAPVADRA